MLITNRSFTVELTAEETEVITSALHNQYKAFKDQAKTSKGNTQIELYNKQEAIKKLRNAFAELVGQRFMGEDA